MNVIVIGGTGFIGEYLVDFLTHSDRVSCVYLLSRRHDSIARLGKVKIVLGDVFDKVSLKELIVEGSVVVNLAYLADEAETKNLELINNLIEVCQERRVRKLIHVSTAVVVGRSEELLISEGSVVCPFSEYDKTKMLLEQAIVSSDATFERIILRPTAVFGPKGKNLTKLASDLCHGSVFKNYLKSCLYGRRTMNLVSVENVVSALGFLILIDSHVGTQTFIVSDDNAPSNNYIDVERIFMRVLGVGDYAIPRIIFPRTILGLVLRFAGKSNINAGRCYSSKKLEALGWVRSQDFERKVEQFAKWYQGRQGA